MENINLKENNILLNNELKRTNDLLFEINKLNKYDSKREELLNELFINKGNNFIIGSNININLASNIKIGNNVNILDGFNASSYGNIIIEDDVKIGFGVSIITDNPDVYNRDILNISDVYISKNAYIGANSIILPGVRIGENAIIGAASVVTHDVLDNTIVAGNPAKEIKKIDDLGFNNKSNDLITLYDLKGGIISKDSDKNLYLIVNNKCLLIAEGNTYNEVVVPEKLNKVFILGDSIRVLDLDLIFDDPNDYKISIYTSSYYYGYFGVYDKGGYYTVMTDDGDVIAVKFYDNFAKFKRIFDYDLNKIDELVKEI